MSTIAGPLTNSVLSGYIASGAIRGGLLAAATSYITGNFSWSGASAGTSGVAIVSGSYTAKYDGNLLIQANAQVQSVSGLFFALAVVSGGVVAASGLGTPPQQVFATWGGVNFQQQFSQTINTTAPVGTAVQYAIIMQPTASGLISGQGSLCIQELQY